MVSPELYKDKIEVNLDGRQIFYMFFGGAVIVGMVFVLGVMVGRRVEARGHLDRAHTAANVDPLAALDRLEGSGGLSFQGALSGTQPEGGAAAGDVEKTINAIAAKKAGPAVVAPAVVAPAVVAPAPAPAPVVVKKDEKKDEAKKDEKKKDDDAPPPPKKERYTLQLSSFQDKSEAKVFLENMKSAGFDATLTEAEVDGKGTFYRVRYGAYKSLDAATDAKAEVEKAAHKSVSIIKL